MYLSSMNEWKLERAIPFSNPPPLPQRISSSKITHIIRTCLSNLLTKLEQHPRNWHQPHSNEPQQTSRPVDP